MGCSAGKRPKARLQSQNGVSRQFQAAAISVRVAVARQIKGNNAAATLIQEVDKRRPQTGVIFPTMHQ
jgi:hypothetical protein